MEMTTVFLFVYGTLLFDQVLESLDKHPISRKPATAHAFKRCKILNQVYPVAIPSPGSQIIGEVHEITQEDLKQLDLYEDEHNEYIRTEAQVTLTESQQTITAYIYAKGPGMADVLENEEWSCGEFKEKHLQKWCEDIRKGEI